MKLLLALSLLGVSLQISAAIPLEQALEVCRAEQNALRRLTCYDSITTDLSLQATAKGAAGTSPAVPAVSVNSENSVVAATQATDSKFGLEHKNIGAENDNSVTAVVTAVNYSPRKELIIEFDNGQRWRQVGSDYYAVKVGQRHTVKRGALSSFLMGNFDNNRTIRVKREK